MLKVANKERMRRAYFVENKSIRAIARELGHSRKTVREAVINPEPRAYQLSEARSSPVMARYQQKVEEWLEADRTAPRKQRHTAHRIYERLRDEEEFTGSDSTVRRFVRLHKQRLGLQSREVFLPLAYDPGQDAQADWDTLKVILAGEPAAVQVFAMRLCYATAPFVVAFPHQRQEALFEGHVRGFEFYQGVPRRIWYDNPATIVRRVLEGRSRVEQEDFARFRTYYLYEPVFCQPGERGAHEKGGVENLLGWVNRNLFVPVPQVETLDELNAHLLARCQEQLEHSRRGQDRTIGERLEEERPYLLPLPSRRFECCKLIPTQVDHHSRVTFETNTYTVPVQFAHRQVLVKAFVDRVEVAVGDQVIARHDRSYERHQDIENPLHYLPLLRRKTGAWEHAQALKNWRATWPKVYEDYVAALERRRGEREGRREFIRILELHQQHSQQEIARALSRALELGCFSFDSVKNLLLQGAEPRLVQMPLDLSMPGRLAAIRVPQPDLRRYDRLSASDGSRRSAATTPSVNGQGSEGEELS